VKYFLAGFGGMLLFAIIIFGCIALLVTYCPVPSGAHKYLVTAGIITGGALMVLVVVIWGAVALQGE
jgi:hypothetical protein